MKILPSQSKAWLGLGLSLGIILKIVLIHCFLGGILCGRRFVRRHFVPTSDAYPHRTQDFIEKTPSFTHNLSKIGSNSRKSRVIHPTKNFWIHPCQLSCQLYVSKCYMTIAWVSKPYMTIAWALEFFCGWLGRQVHDFYVTSNRNWQLLQYRNVILNKSFFWLVETWQDKLVSFWKSLIGHLVFGAYICSGPLRFGCQGLFRVLNVWVPRFVPGT